MSDGLCAYCGQHSFARCDRCDGCFYHCCGCEDPADEDDRCFECGEDDCVCPPNQCPNCGSRCETLCIDDTCRYGECCCPCRVTPRPEPEPPHGGEETP